MKTTYQLKIKSLNKEAIQIYLKTLSKIFKALEISYSQFCLPTTKKRITLLKSPHVNKSAREQFEIQHYQVIISLETTSNSKILTFLALNKPKIITLSIKNI
jgi:small subunit ribosomal protein S10